ncbi:APC family permease [Leptolyngbya sp. KIOST-1]|uniref:APC family permease n=1 Tax=Leptolyngbya sp. KIOST-1 TaxID=1229172 RepID=UPI000AC6D32C|nr:amino acid permease [Leptolyngbya sp. KIOST-1]
MEKLVDVTASGLPSSEAGSRLGLSDAIALIVGVVIGAGIFETPALVAANSTSGTTMLLAWLLGGGISVVGALCYAELATAYPHVGGSYYYLKRAFGSATAFLFSWARMSVLQPGSIALLAFVFGDYMSQIWRLGEASPALYAAGAIALLTLVHIGGLQGGKRTQQWLTVATVIGVALIGLLGSLAPSPAAEPVAASSPGTFGLAMVFVLLSYGGWNEAAYISAELQQPRRNMVRSLLWSIGLITALYLLVNVAYLWGLGLERMAASEAIAADLIGQVLGPAGAVLVSLLIALAALGSLNATLLTGARANYALGQDFARFGLLGRWRASSSTPAAAYAVQGAIALALVGLGTLTRNGFETMVDYTAPVFWFFFLLSGLSLLRLRRQPPDAPQPFRVPGYPVTPLLFCLVCGYLLYSSLVYTGLGALVGVGVVALGLPLLRFAR